MTETTKPDLAKVTADLEWLAGRGALDGIAQIITERRAIIETGRQSVARYTGEYAAECALDLGDWAIAGALIAEVLDVPVTLGAADLDGRPEA